jgi:hypothetical protein
MHPPDAPRASGNGCRRREDDPAAPLLDFQQPEFISGDYNIHWLEKKLRGHLAAAVRNPSFYYLACNIFISTATVTKNIQGVDMAQIVINVFIILLSLFGMGYAINKVWQVSQAGALGATIHDGVINYINVGVNSGVGVLCILTQNWPVFFSQILFCIANVKALYETRNALHREQSALNRPL